jgi:DNA-binding GntR family transcriptional regulator
MDVPEGGFSRRFDYEDRTKLTDSVYDELRRAIIGLRFRPGDVLRESAIGRELGVSKTPVREAFLKLEHDGLVKLIPFRGAQVSGYDANDVREILGLRAILQGECVRQVATEGDQEMLEILRENVATSRKAAERGDVDRVISLLDEFDDILMSRIDNRRAVSLLDNLRDHMMRIGQLTSEIPGRTAKSIEEHAAIVDALETGDADVAGNAMRAHIESVLADEIEALALNDEGEIPEDTESARSSDP